ncbi:hypothetical protein SAMN05444285_101142 [Draconibacterium orientale]|uniref:Uncharacterized protein n=1 Tax=Draconibacterium orientale TaxID=1168034 RepID=A0A1H9YDM2_9BACT|nr:hypothetical protein [Draconibacterium orientale]SES67071.1 hypothetical protein SAMN05444285_101142 [Draconibacterium orientale]
MKVIADFFIESNRGFDVLTEEAMNEVRGGGTPKSRDKDIFDFEEE